MILFLTVFLLFQRPQAEWRIGEMEQTCEQVCAALSPSQTCSPAGTENGQGPSAAFDASIASVLGCSVQPSYGGDYSLMPKLLNDNGDCKCITGEGTLHPPDCTKSDPYVRRFCCCLPDGVTDFDAECPKTDPISFSYAPQSGCATTTTTTSISSTKCPDAAQGAPCIQACETGVEQDGELVIFFWLLAGFGVVAALAAVAVNVTKRWRARGRVEDAGLKTKAGQEEKAASSRTCPACDGKTCSLCTRKCPACDGKTCSLCKDKFCPACDGKGCSLCTARAVAPEEVVVYEGQTLIVNLDTNEETAHVPADGGQDEGSQEPADRQVPGVSYDFSL